MRITVIGSGYVGLVAAACLAEIGHEVISVDCDGEKIEALRRGEVPIHEQFLPELLDRHRGQRLHFSSSLAEAVGSSRAIFIAVGTPPACNGEADLSYVESVTREIALAIHEHKVIVEKSTVPVYTSERIRQVLAMHGVGQNAADVVSNPEFLREGTAVTDFLYPDRIVVGTDSERAEHVLRQIYAPLSTGRYQQSPGAIPRPDQASTSAAMLFTSAKSAELIKHASNAFLAMKISFANAVANICESVGADVQQVCRGIGSDARIGPRFLQAGIGYGGSCFPKDLAAFRAIARECHYDFRLLDEVMQINEDQRYHFLRKVRKAVWTLKGKKMAVLGLAFKGGTDDIRESPAIAIVEALVSEGCRIAAYDPAATERARAVFSSPEAVTFADTPYEAAAGADALLILTDWEEFAGLDLKRIRTALKYPIVIDGRNLFDPEMMADRGFLYSSVGRPTQVPDDSRAPLAEAVPAHVEGVR